MTTSMWLIGLLCIALSGAGLWLMRLPAGYRVERVQRFARTADFMQAYLLDYARWQDWSPWLLHDPQTELHFSGKRGRSVLATVGKVKALAKARSAPMP